MTLPPIDPTLPLSRQIAELETLSHAVEDLEQEYHALTRQLDSVTAALAQGHAARQMLEVLAGTAGRLLAGEGEAPAAPADPALPVPVARSPRDLSAQAAELRALITDLGPGASLTVESVSAVLNVDAGEAGALLRSSVEAGLLFSATGGLAYWPVPVAQVAASEAGTGSTTSAPVTLMNRILEDVAQHPDSSYGAVGERLGASGKSTSSMCSQLTAKGFLAANRDVSPLTYRITPAGRERAGLEAEPAQTPDAPAADPESSPALPSPAPPGEAAALPEPGAPTEAAPEPPTPRPAPRSPSQRRIVQAPKPPKPSPELRAVMNHLREHGPATVQELARALRLPDKRARRTLAGGAAAGQLEASDAYRPVYRLPGDARVHASERPANAAPDQAELAARRQENAALVLALFQGDEELSEVQLRARTNLELSHLRAALLSLTQEGELRRLEGGGPGTRALYRRDALELPTARGDTLSPEGVRIERALREATIRNTRESVSSLSANLALDRKDVEAQLAILHAAGRLRWMRVGHLALLSLQPAEVAA